MQTHIPDSEESKVPPQISQSPFNATTQDTETKSGEKHDGEVAVTHRSSNDSSASNSLDIEPEARPWKKTLIRFGPLAGIFSMCIAIASIFASLGILVGSNHAATKGWSVQPSAYLAVFTAIANQSMRFAAWQGIAIAWWKRATRKESTIAQLHWDWRSGTTLRGALSAGRYWSWLGLACICSTLVTIDGPLLQRATTVVPTPTTNKVVNLEAEVVPEIPTDYTGVWSSTGNSSVSNFWELNVPTSNGSTPDNIRSISHPSFSVGAVVAWQKLAPITGLITGCPGVCKARIQAPAVAITSCSSHIRSVNYSTPHRIVTEYYPFDTIAFVVYPNLLVTGEDEEINLVTGYSQTQDCVGVFNYTACTLKSAIGEYEVTISENTLHVVPGDPKIISLANNTKVQPQDTATSEHKSTLAGIVSNVYSEAQLAAIFRTEEGIQVGGVGSAFQNIFLDPKHLDPNGCPSFIDPHEYTVSVRNHDGVTELKLAQSINKLMFYTGVYAASDLSNLKARLDPGILVSTNVPGHVQGTHNIFLTDFYWFVAASIVEIACIALILPSYYGWWKLGRLVSLSPLEVAKAFDAPALRSCNSNSTGADIARDLGKNSMQYGNVGGKLTFADSAIVEKPQKNARFQI